MVAVRLEVGQPRLGAAGPLDLHPVESFGRAQTQDLPGIAGGEITASRTLQAPALEASGRPGDDGADSRMTLAGHQIEAHPTVAVASPVQEQHRRSAVVGDEQVRITIVVQVPGGQSPGGKFTREDGARLAAPIEVAAVDIFEVEEGFPVP